MMTEHSEKCQPGSIKLTVEPFQLLRLDLPPLLEQAYEELRLPGDPVKCSPAYKLYEYMQNAGQLLCIAVRMQGQLVGYCIFKLQASLHNHQQRVAVNDVIYLLPAYRRGKTGIRLIQKTEALLQAFGIDRVFISAVGQCPKTGKLLESLGYSPAETVYTKLLKG
jgi:GNAT superfamily N-acetyltransferase